MLNPPMYDTLPSMTATFLWFLLFFLGLSRQVAVEWKTATFPPALFSAFLPDAPVLKPRASTMSLTSTPSEAFCVRRETISSPSGSLRMM